MPSRKHLDWNRHASWLLELERLVARRAGPNSPFLSNYGNLSTTGYPGFACLRRFPWMNLNKCAQVLHNSGRAACSLSLAALRRVGG